MNTKFKKRDLIDTLQVELQEVEYKPVYKEDLEKLGCKFTGEKIDLKTANDEFTIYELMDAEEIPRRLLDFCYIASKIEKAGFILPSHYEKYSRLAAITSR